MTAGEQRRRAVRVLCWALAAAFVVVACGLNPRPEDPGLQSGTSAGGSGNSGAGGGSAFNTGGDSTTGFGGASASGGAPVLSQQDAAAAPDASRPSDAGAPHDGGGPLSTDTGVTIVIDGGAHD